MHFLVIFRKVIKNTTNINKLFSQVVDWVNSLLFSILGRSQKKRDWFFKICFRLATMIKNQLINVETLSSRGVRGVRYRRRKWTRRHEFKSWTTLIAIHITLIPLGKVWIQLFSLQLWVNSRADWVLQPWWGN